MKKRVYIETTVVSYFTSRPSRDILIAGHQEATRILWPELTAKYETYISALVYEEAGKGDPEKEKKLAEVEKLQAHVQKLQKMLEMEPVFKIYFIVQEAKSVDLTALAKAIPATQRTAAVRQINILFFLNMFLLLISAVIFAANCTFLHLMTSRRSLRHANTYYNPPLGIKQLSFHSLIQNNSRLSRKCPDSYPNPQLNCYSVIIRVYSSIPTFTIYAKHRYLSTENYYK